MKTIEEIRNDVAFSYGYINWEGFKDELRKRPTILLGRNLEFDKIVDQVAKEYSRWTERDYEVDDSKILELESEIEDLEEEAYDLESEIHRLTALLDRHHINH